MLNLRRSHERGAANHGWLDTRHTFSFAGYYDPEHMGFRSLRVINEDRVRPGRGFGTHGHRDMEILSYVLGGALEHADSMGTGSVIRPGEIQRMTAGTGVMHSEYNHSKADPVHFLQIWIEPGRRGLEPSYEQKAFEAEDGAWTRIASPEGGEGAVTVHQDLNLHVARLAPGSAAAWERKAGRHVWLHVARGRVKVTTDDGEETLSAGDAASTSDAALLRVEGIEDAEVLLFDLA